MKKQTLNNGSEKRRSVNKNPQIDNIDSADETTEEDDEDFDPSEFDPSYSDFDSTKGTNDDDEEPKETEQVDEEEEKRRTDRLWSDFLSGVEKISKKNKSDSDNVTKTVTKVFDFAGERVEVQETISVAKTNGAASANSTTSATNNTESKCYSPSESSCSSNSSTSNIPVTVTSNNTSTPSTSSSSAKTLIDSSKPSSTTPTTPGLRRGGISFLSGNPAQIGLATKPGTKRIGGLSAVLNALHSNKKQKISTIEKTKLDWQSFKEKEGIDEELKTHTKSKAGFIERQEFLQRADLRQFEIEKNLRAKARRNP